MDATLPRMADPRPLRFAIIGAGMSGILAAYELE
jgi:cation diffusion facilitator CzcD-associated flavoprotein CzcO